MKKLLATMLALLMALTLLPTAVFAEITQANGLPEASNGVYTLNDDATLLANVTGSIVVPAGKTVTLDLNGFTLNGGKNNSTATVTNNGTLTITDSSSAKTGTIKREDKGNTTGTTYYVIENGGTMTIEQAKVENNSGYEQTNPSGTMVGSALICNVGTSGKSAMLTITNGTFTQENFIVVKNDDFGVLKVDGGTFTSKHSAIQNWNEATLNGGIVKGQIWTAGYRSNGTDYVGKTVINNVNHTGEMVMQAYNNQVTAKPSLEIKGGTFDITKWLLKQGTGTGIAPATKFGIAITNGTFSTNPAAYVPNTGYAITLEEDAYVVSTTGAAKLDSKTETASATLNNTAIGVVADKNELKLDISTKTAVESDNQTAYNNATTGVDTEQAVVVTINLTDKEKTKLFTSAVEGAYAIVTVPYRDNLESVTVKYLNGNNAVSLTQVDQLSLLAGKSFTVNQNGFYHYNAETGVITMKLPHFSQYLLNGIVPTVTPEPVTYTVTYDPNGGTLTAGSPATTNADGKLTRLPTPTRSGYRFDGWYTAAVGGDKVTTATEFTANATVYAHWTMNYHGPSRVNTGSGSTTTTPTVAAPKTADTGIAIYGVMAISSVLGMGYIGKKKF